MNVMNSLKNKVLPAHIAERKIMSCNFDMNVSDIYSVPTPEEACERVYKAMVRNLAKRYRNEKSISNRSG